MHISPATKNVRDAIINVSVGVMAMAMVMVMVMVMVVMMMVMVAIYMIVRYAVAHMATIMGVNSVRTCVRALGKASPSISMRLTSPSGSITNSET